MTDDSAIRIALVVPDLLGTYGDRGNALVLAQRLRWRGHRAEIVTVLSSAETLPDSCDIYLLGGGEDVAQQAAVNFLARGDGLRRAVDAGAVVLGVCGGLQVLGTSFTTGDGVTHRGLGLIDISTEPGERRAIGELSTRSEEHELGLLTGFENHLGRSRVGPAARPLGRVLHGVGNGADETEGAVSERIVCTYLHGPALARNPLLADTMLSWAVGESLSELPPFPELTELRSERVKAAG
ncbi:glutamine amidotransferase [Actinopolyspora erythraea]|uniref:Lipid II isoglutaminyl synthase (glutamine-hydrolyzing) subunit GatD n=1 Tax=Actinopolyspora erythraea TaxID=414996 RepID=A0ABR4X475_9ACTN|nr:glutamine amidotransferase [Actinopolyspora erythraea]KGI81460.1 glutamine amidotransferase [Actinopolyspora erythraea]